MESIELDDIQRLVIQGYAERRAAIYALLQVTDPVRARRWLGRLLPWVGAADERGREEDRKREDDRSLPLKRRVSIAFTWAGLKELGFPEGYGDSAGFVGEFREGMVAPHRSLILGDTDASDPSGWRWGQRGDPIHVLLLVYSESKNTLAGDWSAVRSGLDGVAPWDPGRAEFRNPVVGYLTEDGKEHFGFRDGISQPYVAGSDTNMRPSGPYAAAATVAPGEFVLGYRNEMGNLPASPAVPRELDPDEILPFHPEDPAEGRDFGRNGSYLVMRQLEQHVAEFRDFLASLAPERRDRSLLAAKLVGRWKCGRPLVEAPDDNDFGFYSEDRHGFRCPVGSHIRRVNPRDAFADPSMGVSREEAQRLVNRHRLIRRGRLYGENDPDAKGERGLLFLCLNANLQRQFEFVQRHWINGSKFGGLDNELDPLVGSHPMRAGSPPMGDGRMTIQGRPLPRRIEGIPRFVTVRGGGYFFLPGLRALRFLANLEPARWTEPVTRAPGFPRFRPRRFCSSADLQTLANQVRRAPDLSGLERTHRQVVFPMDDGTRDELLGMFHEPKRHGDGRPLVLIIHGLPGSQDSEVVLHTAAYFLQRGHPVLRLNQRGAGPSRGKTQGIYHAGRSKDLYEVVQQLRREFPGREVVMMAYSLGANVMLKMLGETHPGDHVRAAVSVSAPIDLAVTAAHLRGLQWPRRRIYVGTLLRETKRCALGIRGLDAGQRAAIADATSLYEFDEGFLARFNRFASADDYYAHSSSAPLLPSISVSTLLIHAEDDPIVPFAPWRTVDWAANDRLHTLFAESGGHAGFHQRGSRAAWHDLCAEIFFDR